MCQSVMIVFLFKDVIPILCSCVSSKERKKSKGGEFIDNSNRVNMSGSKSLTLLVGMGGRGG